MDVKAITVVFIPHAEIAKKIQERNFTVKNFPPLRLAAWREKKILRMRIVQRVMTEKEKPF